MTGHLVVPTLTALTAENQPLAQFWAASCESWANAEQVGHQCGETLFRQQLIVQQI
jgi:hypothetical protein